MRKSLSKFYTGKLATWKCVISSQLISSQFKLLKFERPKIFHSSTQSSLGEHK